MELIERLRAYAEAGESPPTPARDPVNLPMIRHWCDAMGDANPVYTDPAVAAQSLHGGIVAPPTMLQAWIMPGPGSRERTAAGDGMPGLLRALDEAGFTSVVATNCRQEYRRYLAEGETLSVTSRVADVSDEKQTALGDGHFVTQRMTYRDAAGEVVATMDFRILKFRPRVAASEPPAIPRPRPSMSQDTEFFWKGLAEGRLLVASCAGCQTLRHPPEPMCRECQSLEWSTVACSGRGTIYSYVVAHHPPIPPFSYPHPVALVELEEGVRLVAELVDVAPDAIEIGAPVEAVFEPAAPGDDLVVPRFRPAGAAR